MFFITHIDKFFHNSPGAEMCLGTPHFIYRAKFFSALLRNSYGISCKAKKTQNVVLSVLCNIGDNTAF